MGKFKDTLVKYVSKPLAALTLATTISPAFARDTIPAPPKGLERTVSPNPSLGLVGIFPVKVDQTIPGYEKVDVYRSGLTKSLRTAAGKMYQPQLTLEYFEGNHFHSVNATVDTVNGIAYYLVPENVDRSHTVFRTLFVDKRVESRQGSKDFPIESAYVYFPEFTDFVKVKEKLRQIYERLGRVKVDNESSERRMDSLWKKQDEILYALNNQQPGRSDQSEERKDWRSQPNVGFGFSVNQNGGFVAQGAFTFSPASDNIFMGPYVDLGVANGSARNNDVYEVTESSVGKTLETTTTTGKESSLRKMLAGMGFRMGARGKNVGVYAGADFYFYNHTHIRDIQENSVYSRDGEVFRTDEPLNPGPITTNEKGVAFGGTAGFIVFPDNSQFAVDVGVGVKQGLGTYVAGKLSINLNK